MKFFTKFMFVVIIIHSLGGISIQAAEAQLDYITVNALFDSMNRNDLEGACKILRELDPGEGEKMLSTLRFDYSFENRELQSKERWDWNLFTLAVHANKMDFVKLFIIYGADIDECICKKDSEDIWITPVAYAIKDQNVPMLNILLRHSKLSINDWAARFSNGKLVTPLAIAAHYLNKEAIKVLHVRGADFSVGSDSAKGNRSVVNFAFAGGEKTRMKIDPKNKQPYLESISDDEDDEILPIRAACLEAAVDKYASTLPLAKTTRSLTKRRRLNPEERLCTHIQPPITFSEIPAWYVADSPERKVVQDPAKVWVPGPIKGRFPGLY